MLAGLSNSELYHCGGASGLQGRNSRSGERTAACKCELREAWLNMGEEEWSAFLEKFQSAAARLHSVAGSVVGHWAEGSSKF
ncbi:hypothetical protein C4D60_Mb07t07210 [Musa balbisiana]|uniref:Uncharacterized protein n=1 Tax=Musa balbisiana TaxID=52838 RepID=A0A4S8JDL3_MUSBA|nr:hypothetical protein C4D60_Mb07t07210 [Musa balbisiana]